MSKKRKTTTATRSVVIPPVTPALPPMLHMRWIKTLIIQGHANADVRQLLANDALPSPSDIELDRIRGACVPPAGFQRASMTHTPSMLFLVQHQLQEFCWPNSQAAPLALKLLRTPRARELVESGIIVGVPDAAIIEILATHFRHETSLPAIALFRAAFFDVAAVTRAQLRVVVEARVRQGLMHGITGEDEERAARRALSNDPRIIAASLPCSGAAWASVLLSLGMTPPKRQLSAVVSELEQLASVRANQALMRGGRDDERRAESYVAVLQKLVQIKDAVKNPTDNLAQTLLSRFNLRKDEKPMTTIADLVAQGDEVAPMELGPPPRAEATREEVEAIGGDRS